MSTLAERREVALTPSKFAQKIIPEKLALLWWMTSVEFEQNWQNGSSQNGKSPELTLGPLQKSKLRLDVAKQIFAGKKFVANDLVALGATAEIAQEMASRVPPKPNIFSYLLAKIDLYIRENQMVEIFTNGSRPKKKDLSYYRHVFEALAFTAYLFDEAIDRQEMIEDQQDKSEYAISKEVAQAKAELTFNHKFFHDKFEQLVNFLFTQENDFQIKRLDTALIERLKENDLEAYYYLAQYIILLKQNKLSKEQITLFIQPLADVLTGETIVDQAWHIHQKQSVSAMIIHLDFPFAVEKDEKNSTIELSPLETAILSSVTNPGVNMVAIQHYMMIDKLASPSGDSLRDPNVIFKETPGLKYVARALSLLVRLSDDWGDMQEDNDNNSFNLLLLDEEKDRELFFSFCRNLDTHLNQQLGENWNNQLEELAQQLYENISDISDHTTNNITTTLLSIQQLIVQQVSTKWNKESADLKRLIYHLNKISHVAIDIGTRVNDQRFTSE